MLRILLSLLFTLAMFTSPSLRAEQDVVVPIVAVSQLTNTQDKISRLQQTIEQESLLLLQTKGEQRAFTEYRINDKSSELHDKIGQLIAAPDADQQYLVALVQSQMAFLEKVETYLDDQIMAMRLGVSQEDDSKIILAISQREFERDHYLKAQLTTLQWAETLDMDVSIQLQKLTEFMLERADQFDSLVHYTQHKLQKSVAEASSAGVDITPEQKANVMALKERLEHSSSTLAVSAAILETLGQDVAQFKQTLFSVSGDITQDVLNFSVASNLLQGWAKVIKDQTINNGPSLTFKIVVFLFILFVASLVAKIVTKIIAKTVRASKLQFSQLLQEFFISLSSKVVFAVGLLIALSQLGFELGPLLAGFGIAGVIIGFALQDTLSNFASGMMILIYRPFDVGDLINAANVTGRVSHMSLVSTTIKTLDNQRLIVPNNKIWGDTINNITAEHQRRVDMTFGISYSDNVEHAETILKSIVEQHPKVQAHPEPMVKLHTLGESSVDFIVRPWVTPDDYWEVYWDITREVKIRFDAEGISIPFPQRDVHIYQK
ncbi:MULTISPECIES: mechanosensitive ion channel family protein [Shewanella]|uniref:Small-conductance mechanosensitive channel n=1 Tax=Shewanella psychromarinicola TaxID=2487742 RepID=A0A3N4E6A3_9GAMM|nr:mechanosensitive ion channel family protein [Shewanella psychromarinicola]AZG34785.1 mechanosensitive ion channel family protein [Shewanella psychromarinicola]MCL1084088.1 mechanosensitive ion channel family protein [Shewanella psychromarinicola]RPA33613.1 mechanosensitive ion channel family protein [Shewanella psychromarinicola]